MPNLADELRFHADMIEEAAGDPARADQTELRLLRRAAEAVDVLRELSEVEDQPCRYDHHGYCQEHGWFETDPPCAIKRAREIWAAQDA